MVARVGSSTRWASQAFVPMALIGDCLALASIPAGAPIPWHLTSGIKRRFNSVATRRGDYFFAKDGLFARSWIEVANAMGSCDGTRWPLTP